MPEPAGPLGPPGRGAGRVAAIAAAAAVVRRVYVAHLRVAVFARDGVESDWGAGHTPAWDGGDTDAGTRPAIWPRIAAVCVDRGFDPAEYVAAQFADGTIRRPNFLCGEAAVERFRRHGDGAAGRLRGLLANQKARFASEVRWRMADLGLAERDAARSVLADTRFGLSAVFRASVAARFGFADVLPRFLPAAAQQYAFATAAYDAAWGPFVADLVRDAGRRFTAHVAGGGPRP